MPLIITTPFRAPDIPLNGLTHHWDVDESNMWQDTGGTIPASPGNTVDRIDDLVGSVNPTTGTPSNPTLQSLGNLFFDSSGAASGFSDIMIASPTPLFTIEGPFTFAAKVNLTGVIDLAGGGSSQYGGVVFRFRRPIGNSGWGISLRQFGSPLSYDMVLFGDTDLTPVPISYSLGESTPGNVLVLVTYAGAGGDMSWRVNGNAAGTHSSLTIGGSGSGDMRWFRYQHSPEGGQVSGYFYEALFYNRVLGAGEITQVENYINGRHP